MPNVVHSKLRQWLDPRRRENEPTNLGTLKTELARLGVNGRGWRLYLDYGDALFLPLGYPWIHPDQPFTTGPNAVAYLRLLQACEMDVLPPQNLVSSLQFWAVPNKQLCCVPPLFFRAAWKAAVANQYSARDSEVFVREVILVSQWFFGTDACQTTDSGLLKAGWPALLRRQHAWSLEQQLVASPRQEPTGDEWNPYIRRVEFGLYRFEALTNEAQLIEEGKIMQHCVGSYLPYCCGGVRRIYSVRGRKSGLRIATLSLEYVDYGNGTLVWECDQLSGPKNTEILQPDLINASDAVLRAFFDLPVNTFSKPVLPTEAEENADEEWCCDF